MIKATCVALFYKLKNIRNFYNHTKTISFDSIIDGNVKIGKNFSCGNQSLITACANGQIIIGNNVAINKNVMINADINGIIEIGDNVLIGPNVVLRASSHSFDGDKSKPIKQQGHKPGKIIIKNNVWIGSNVVILPNIQINERVIIGAGSIVTKDLESNGIYAGVPAKLIKNF